LLVSFENTNRVIGLKQSRRAVKDGRVLCAYVAQDADEGLAWSFEELCREYYVPVSRVPSMAELGQAAGIRIGAAVVATLK